MKTKISDRTAWIDGCVCGLKHCQDVSEAGINDLSDGLRKLIDALEEQMNDPEYAENKKFIKASIDYQKVLFYLLGKLNWLKRDETGLSVFLLEFSEIFKEESLNYEVDCFLATRKYKLNLEEEYKDESKESDSRPLFPQHYIDHKESVNDTPFHIGDPSFDTDENPWIDVFGEGEEAEAAYWNTD